MDTVGGEITKKGRRKPPFCNIKKLLVLIFVYISIFIKLPRQIINKIIMKKILLLLAITGCLFACNKEDEEEPDYYKLFEQAIAETDQEAATKLFEGVWEHHSSFAGNRRIKITKDYFIFENDIWSNSKPDTTMLLWAKIDNTYKLIREVEQFQLGYKYEFLHIEFVSSTTFYHRGWCPFVVDNDLSSSVDYFFNYDFSSYIEWYTKVE